MPVNVRPFFVAHAQSPELIEPCEGSLHHPAPSAQSTAMFYVSLGEPGRGRQADLGGLPSRHNHGRLARNQGDGGDALAFPASAGLPQQVRVLVASRYGWLR